METSLFYKFFFMLSLSFVIAGLFLLITNSSDRGVIAILVGLVYFQFAELDKLENKVNKQYGKKDVET